MLELGPLALGQLGERVTGEAPAARDESPAVGGKAEKSAGPSAVALADLIDETVGLFRRLRAAAGQVYGSGARSGGRRGVLRELERSGPQTVPQLARTRSVTRQHVQTLVNPLAEEGLVEFVDNPAHKRSRLVRLTEAGHEYVEEMSQRESRLLSELGAAVSDDELRRAIAVLRAIGTALVDERWQRAVQRETQQHR